MTPTKDVLRKALAIAALAFGLVGAGAGAAWAATPVPAPNPPAGPTHPGLPATHPSPATPATPAPPAPVTDSGRIAAVNTRTLSVRDNNGHITVFQLTPRTTILQNGRPTIAVRLAAQDRVQVTGVRTGNVDTANRVIDTGR